MLPTKKKILVTVKAYPNPSKKYKETVCCAGIDLDTNKWIRLFPIPFRYLGKEKQFNKYSVIQATCNKARDDKRPESYKVDSDSINIIEHIKTEKGGWKKRGEIVWPTISPSFCQILEDMKHSDKSLGAFRPTQIDFVYERIRLKEIDEEMPMEQLSFFDASIGEIEKLPVRFYYTFKCLDVEECKGHKLPIIDWEIGEAFRKWAYKDTATLLEKIKEKWLTQICSDKNDVIFFVGNQLRFRENFMVLGVFYPPKA